jgi:iron complex transport system substrate-binding protein
VIPVAARIRHALALTAAAVLTCLPPACVSGWAGTPHTVTDAAGRKVAIADSSRIVSIGGAVTEILYALGLEQRIVAVDQTGAFPPVAKAKPNVGYMRALSAEGVLSLAPTLILAIEGSGPPDVLDVLSKASVPLVLVPEARDPDSVARKIRFIAEAAGVAGQGEKVARTVLDDFAALADARDRIKRRRRALFVLAIGSGAPIVGGSDTSASAIFALAGADNALSSVKGFRPAADEAAFAANPDAVVIMAEREHALTADAVFSMPAFAGTAAAKARRLIVLPGSYLLNFGPRAAHAARDLSAALYPEFGIPPLPPRPWTGPGEGSR